MRKVSNSKGGGGNTTAEKLKSTTKLGSNSIKFTCRSTLLGHQEVCNEEKRPQIQREDLDDTIVRIEDENGLLRFNLKLN